MKLKNNMIPADFLKAVEACSGEVEFRTADGDVLNLKSALTTYIFVVAAENPELIEGSSVFCKKEEDYEILKEYLVES